MALGRGADEPLRRLPRPALYQSFLSSPHPPEEGVPVDHPDQHRWAGRIRCFHLHLLFFRLQADPEGLGARDSRAVFRAWSRLRSYVALSR